MNSSTLKGEENNRVGNDCKARGKDHTALISFSTFESVEYSGSSRMTYWTPDWSRESRHSKRREDNRDRADNEV